MWLTFAGSVTYECIYSAEDDAVTALGRTTTICVATSPVATLNLIAFIITYFLVVEDHGYSFYTIQPDEDQCRYFHTNNHNHHPSCQNVLTLHYPQHL